MEKDVTLTVKVYGIETQEDLDAAIDTINEIAYVSDVQVKDKATDGIGAEDGDFDGTLLMAGDEADDEADNELEFTVEWTMDVNASNHRQAAERALGYITSNDPGSLARVFEVYDGDQHTSHKIDLSPGAIGGPDDLSTDQTTKEN